MKAEELMIDDWVYNHESNQYQRVWQLDYDNVVLDGYYSYDYNDIEPIPLTPEILEKNGWKVKEGFVQHGNFGDGPLMLWHTEENKILRNFIHELEISDLSTDKGFRVRIECNYVHELQHALRLCGIKKEIVL